MRTFLLLITILFSCHTNADDIAFGKIKGNKIYNFPDNQRIAIHFESDATNVKEKCERTAYLLKTEQNENTVNQMLSLAMAAYMSEKKIRANSLNNTCNANFLAIQEELF